MSHPTFEALLESGSAPEAFVREALAGLEAAHRRIALLALADWARLERAAPPLFGAIATLQRPSWGSWNGLILGLREARRDILRDASTEERKHVDGAHLLRRVLQVLEQPLEEEERLRLVPFCEGMGLRLPKTLRRRELLALPIALRNRVAHDAPTDPAWWASTADGLRPLLELHVESPALTQALGNAELEPPWRVEADGAAWTFSGLTPQFEARYLDPGGNLRLDAERGAELLHVFQRLLGKADVQAKHFRRLLGKLAPEDIKGVLMGDLLVGRPVGRGGFATVHVGRQLSTGRKVAVKILHDGMEEDARERFRREAAYLSRFREAHIVQVLGYGEERWSAPKNISLMDEDWFKAFKKTAPIKTFMALEWIDGETLEDLYQRPSDEAPGITQLAGWMGEAAAALGAVHAAHLIHRDVKPGNLMVAEDRGIVLMDFGIARSQDEGRTLLTATGTAVGTPAYMSPEQLRATDADAEVGPPSDVYSLCATFYELFACERLYHHDTEAPETVRTHKIEGHRPELPRLRAQQLPWEIRTILLGGLEADPSDRYPSAAALREDLQRFLRNEPIRYRKPSLARRAQLAYRRHRAVANLVGAFVILAAGLVFWLQAAAAEERRADLRRREQAVLASAEVARRAWTERSATLVALSGPDAPPLRSANGEPLEGAITAWMGAHMRAADALEELLDLAKRAPTEAARLEIDPNTVLAEHAGLSRRAVQTAIELDRFTLAHMWIARAAGAGALDEGDRVAAEAEIDAARKRRIEEDLEKARAILADARAQTDIAPEFVEQNVIALTRLQSPDLVRLLLEPTYLDSKNDIERRIVIGALGRIGDQSTKGPQTLDAVEAICMRLTSVNVKRELPLALALARALGDLKDPRAHGVFDRKRREAGASSPFSERSYNAFTRVPLPATEGDSNEDADALFDRAQALADKGRWPEVLALYDKILAKDPDSAIAYRERARARGMTGDQEGALEDYAEALERWPDWADAFAGRALSLIDLHRIQEAREDAERAVALDSGGWLGHLALGSVEASVGRWERAEASFTRVIELQPQLPQPYMQRGMARLQLGKRKEAEADFKQVKELNPDSPEVLVISAQAYMAAERFDLALADADRAITLDPTRPELYGIRALCWAKLGHAHEKVEADIQAALRLAPASPGLKLLLSQAWLAIGRTTEGLEAIESVLRGDPDNTEALLMRGRVYANNAKKEYEKALADYTTAIRHDPDFMAAYLERASLLARMGQPERALQDLDQAARLSPRSLPVRVARGRAYLHLERWADALRVFSDVLRRDPLHRVALRLRGVARREMGDHEGSIEDLSRVLSRVPNDVDTLFERASTFLRAAEHALAEQDLSRVIELEPKHAGAFCNRAIARRELGRLQEAWEDAQQAVRLSPKVAKFRLQMGDAARRMQRPRDALEAYAAAIAMDEKYAAAYTRRGSLLLEDGDLAAALRDFERALVLDPESATAYGGRGLVFLKQGRHAEAIEDFTMGLGLKPIAKVRAVIHNNRAVAHGARGRPEAAMRDYAEAIRVNPAYPRAYLGRGMLHAELGEDRKAVRDLRTYLKLAPKAPEAERVRRYLAAMEEN